MLTEKYCGGCKQTKPVSEWYKNSIHKKDGLSTQCKVCQKSYCKTHRLEAGPQAKERARNNDPQRIAYRNAREEKPYHRAICMVASARANAKRFKIPVNLEVSDVLPSLERGTCDITGLPFDFRRGLGRRVPFGPSLDKDVPALGYVKGNVRVVCWAYNAARGDWGDDVLKVLVEALVKKWSQTQPSPSTTS